ncbi:glutathione S-transferase family protein [Variovorax sp. J2P1-59]|uniref:glutathione S-transferase family protein n=1 Tax=Variovorax flavidus TaxID=3053501 RepID=UPI0025760EE9|nr:glutathione S-transferase family protein [Variovorax sp. J2P1-59]MDM0078150.1 glutathione S-transferase family protein [Variovorax sp. J2P1-59]
MDTLDHLTLYFSKDSCAIASIAALEDVGVPFGLQRVDMSLSGAGDENYMAINSRRQVPALWVGGRIVRETGSIFHFLQQHFPSSRTLPTDPQHTIKAMEWIGYLGGTLHPAFRILFLAPRWVGDDAVAKKALWTHTVPVIEKLLHGIDGELEDGAWVLGERSAIDYYLFVFAHWALMLRLPLPPRLAAHHARTRDLPAMQRALLREAEQA